MSRETRRRFMPANFSTDRNVRLRSIRTHCCAPAGARKAPCKTARVLQSAFRSDLHRIIQSGKASLIESTPLFGTTTTTGTLQRAEGEDGQKGREGASKRVRARQRKRRVYNSGRETLYRGVIIKVTRTPVKRLTSRSQTSRSNTAE